MSKPFSQACENNKDPILAVIGRVFRPGDRVLEIGTYTAQHACHFAANLPGVTWLPSDAPASMAVVEAALAYPHPDNILTPIALDVADPVWPLDSVDGVFSANTLHIMSADHVSHFFRGVGEVLKPGGVLCVYGPFKYDGRYTSDSNASFDLWLKDRDPVSGIRDIETVNALAAKAGLHPEADHAMPANNRLLVWKKTENKNGDGGY